MNLTPTLLNPNAVSIAWMGYASRQALEHAQRQRRDALVEAAVHHSPFYQRHIGESVKKGVPFSELPRVTKPELMANFSDWVTDPDITLADVREHLSDLGNIGRPYRDRYLVWESSGSSGIPGVFIQDVASMQVYDALEGIRITAQESLQRLCNPFWIGNRIAFLGATNGHFASNVSFERVRLALPYMRQKMQSFSILQPAETLIEELNRFDPTIMATYPSVALQLSEYEAHGKLIIQPAEILTGGERLSLALRRLIEQTFGCKTRASYGASEFLPIARECDAGRLHVNSDWVLLEPVDDAYQPIDDGELSDTVLLTNLANTTQPLIRYDLQDSVRISHEQCPCASHLPTIEVVGRCDDVIRLRDTRGDVLCISPMAITTILEDDVGVFDFQLIQKSVDRFSLHLGQEANRVPGLVEKCRLALVSYLTGQGAMPVELEVKILSTQCIERSGKTKRVVCA
jgi:phenylacetate-coenzyme A ligase PaaK-like adenylate-forming protein